MEERIRDFWAHPETPALGVWGVPPRERPAPPYAEGTPTERYIYDQLVTHIRPADDRWAGRRFEPGCYYGESLLESLSPSALRELALPVAACLGREYGGVVVGIGRHPDASLLPDIAAVPGFPRCRRSHGLATRCRNLQIATAVGGCRLARGQPDTASAFKLQEQRPGRHILELPLRVTPVPECAEFTAQPCPVPVRMRRQQLADQADIRLVKMPALYDHYVCHTGTIQQTTA